MTTCRSAVLVFLAAAATACSGRSSSAVAAQGADTSKPAASVAPAAAHAAPAQTGGDAAAAPTITGTVEETMNASNYTYVRVKTPRGDVWAASSQFPARVGDRVTIPLESPMENFHSQSLKRDFPLIYFASQITKEGEPSQTMANPHAGVPMSQSGAKVTDPIAPPPGGSTIEKVWADRKSLVGKKISVNGKVVKFNGGIMGRNWLHIQDGSGSEADGTHDLTVTSDDVAKVGDVITVSGTVAIDKDFGAGYKYAVILEGATITPTAAAR